MTHTPKLEELQPRLLPSPELVAGTLADVERSASEDEEPFDIDSVTTPDGTPMELENTGERDNDTLMSMGAAWEVTHNVLQRVNKTQQAIRLVLNGKTDED